MKQSKLETAIRDGDLDKVRELIAAGVDVTTALDDGTTPIQLAARERQVTILRALAAAGAGLADLEALSFEERLMLFLDSSLDVRPDDDLISASELSEWAERAVGEAMDPRLAAEIAAHEGALFRAVRTGDIEMLRERITAGDDIDQVRDITLDTPLTQAVQKGDEDMVRELIAAGANVDHNGFSTPLSFALPNLRLVKILTDAGANVYARGLDHRSALERAVHRALFPTSPEDSPLLVRYFLESGVHPPHAESSEGTLLMEAEHRQAWELYQDLLPHYSEDVARESFEELRFHQDVREADGGFMQWTFDIKRTARAGDLDGLQEALAKCPQADPDDEDAKYRDPAKEIGQAVIETLTHLENKQQLEATRLLIAAGAALDDAKSYEARRGSTPLAVAAESWHRLSKEAMQLLLDAGIDIDQRGHLDRTPLMYAVLVAYRHGAALKKAVPLLLEAGADVHLEDECGLTAWSLAKAPLIEADERERLNDANLEDPFFDGPDLSDLFSDAANKADARRSRAARCRQALAQLEAAGADTHGEAELRLVMAATAGNVERVQELLAAGASADARAVDGRPAIVAAAESGSHECVAALIAAGLSKVDASMPNQPSALEVAVRRADEAMTRQLIDAGANVFMLVSMSRAALTAAEEAGGHAVVEMLRECLPPEVAHIDRDVELEIESEDLAYESQRDLPRQAAFGDLAKVRELLTVEGVEVDGYDAFRRTPLAAAAEAGQLDIVRELIAAGADVNTSNGVVGSPRSTPLTAAAIGSSAERDAVLGLLLEAGAEVDRRGADGRTVLSHAVERDVGFFGRIGEFALSTRTLIAAGADLEIRDPYGLTAWMRAMSLASAIVLDDIADQYEAVAGLLEKAGASTAGLPEVELIWAILAFELDRVRELLEAGADASARRHDGATALMLAVRDGEAALAQMLIDAGSDVDARQWLDRGPTAMDAAVEAGDQKLVRMLTAAGASPATDDLARLRSASPILRDADDWE